MSKRPYPFKENIHAVKKQVGHESKPREILSADSERTLQLLYKGAAKQFESREEPKKTVSRFQCSQCSVLLIANTKCYYCEKIVCSDCLNICKHCDEEFCENCLFVLHETDSSVCYTCYRNTSLSS